MKTFTLGSLGGNAKAPKFALGKLPKIAAPGAKAAALPKAARGAGTLRLNRLPLSKVRTGPGY
jgi:hypothetical protein